MSVRRRAVTFALLAIALASSATAIVAGCSEESGPDSPPAPPRGFFGVVPQTPLVTEDLDRMERGNIGVIRTYIPWAVVDPTTADDTNWETIDPIVLGAADRGIEVLPFVFGTPAWAAELDGHTKCAPDCATWAPRSAAALDAWGEFITGAVERYGPDGEFWQQHPQVDPIPIQTWQIWNEQNSPSFYQPKPDVHAYADLLAASERAIHASDPDARVILGGMFGSPLGGEPPAITAWDYLRELYDAGAADSFDGVAVHPYGAKTVKIDYQVSQIRDEVEAADDDASTWITEIGWASNGPPDPLNKGPQGQAEQLEAAYELLLAKRLEWDIENVSWYSWRDIVESSSPCDWCGGSGLFPTDSLDEPKPAWESFVSFTGGS